MADVKIKRTKLKIPSIDDPERETYQVEYRTGELPPRFIFIPVKDWTPELEKEKIREHMDARAAATEEILTL